MTILEEATCLGGGQACAGDRMRKTRRRADEEARLFREAVRGRQAARGRARRRAAAPKRASARALHARRPRRGAAARASRPTATTRLLAGGDELVFHRPQVTARGAAPAAPRRVPRAARDRPAWTDGRRGEAGAARSSSIARLEAAGALRAHHPWQGAALGSPRPGAQDGRQRGAAPHAARCSPTSPRGRSTAARGRCTCCSGLPERSAARLSPRMRSAARAAPRWQSCRAPRRNVQHERRGLLGRSAAHAPRGAGCAAPGACRLARRRRIRAAKRAPTAPRARRPRAWVRRSPPPTAGRWDESAGARSAARASTVIGSGTAKKLPRPSRLARSPGSKRSQLPPATRSASTALKTTLRAAESTKAALGRVQRARRRCARRARLAPSRPKRCGPK